MEKQGRNSFRASLAGFGVMVVLSVVLIGASEPMYKAIAGRNRPVSEVPIYNEGIYEGSGRGYGGPVTVTIKVSEYEIEDVKISAPDETPEIGKAVAEKLSKEIWLRQSYRLDSVSGATMTSNAVKRALSHCFRGAAKKGTELAGIIEMELAEENSAKEVPEVSELLKNAEDGIYSYLSETADENGFKDQIQLTVKEHKIKAVIWDCVGADGIGKRILSEEGKYNMTENGPKWYEQADALGRYVVDKQSTDGLMNEVEGTDAVASVSIYVGGFQEALSKCLLSAGVVK